MEQNNAPLKKVKCVITQCLQNCSKEIWAIVISFICSQPDYINDTWSFQTACKSKEIFLFYVTIKQLNTAFKRLATCILRFICPIIRNENACHYWTQYSDVIGSMRMYNKIKLFHIFGPGVDHSSLHTLIIDGCDFSYNYDHKTLITWLTYSNLKRLFCNNCLFIERDVQALARYSNLYFLKIHFRHIYMQHNILDALTVAVPNLQKLAINTRVPITIPSLPNLIELYYHIDGLSSSSMKSSLELKMLPKLQKVFIIFNGGQSDIVFEHLPSLNDLFIKGDYALKSVKFWHIMPSLQTLTLKTHSCIEYFSDTFANVETLKITDTIDNEMLTKFHNIRFLEICQYEHGEEFYKILSNMKHLITLSIYNKQCDVMTASRCLAQLKRILPKLIIHHNYVEVRT